MDATHRWRRRAGFSLVLSHSTFSKKKTPQHTTKKNINKMTWKEGIISRSSSYAAQSNKPVASARPNRSTGLDHNHYYIIIHSLEYIFTGYCLTPLFIKSYTIFLSLIVVGAFKSTSIELLFRKVYISWGAFVDLR